MIVGRAQIESKDGETLVKEFVTTRTQQAKEHAIKAYLPLVKHIIGKMNIPATGTLKREDIYQFGIVGLLDALERFTPEYGVSFKTFAYRRIHGEIIDAIRRVGVLNREQMKWIKKITTTTEKLSSILGREPIAREICEEVGISEERYFKIRQYSDMNITLSLDDGVSVNGDDILPRKETIVDESQIPPDVELEREGLKNELKSTIKMLPERKRLILALYYYEELTLIDIGQLLGISESRVSQILSNTLTEIRDKIIIK